MATPGVSRLFVDTNLLIYATSADSPWQSVAERELNDWRASGTQLVLSVQVLREYLAVVTRPDPTRTAPPDWTAIAANLAVFRKDFLLLEDTHAASEELEKLLPQFAVRGRQVHDANIVATMRVGGVKDLLTHNTADFARFASLITVHSLVSVPQSGEARS
jgi:predicted nucleic acid-binding protein